MAGYSPELLDRVADSVSRAQTYWTRIGQDGSATRYQVGFSPPPTEADPEPADIIVAGFPSREQAIDARDVLEARARAAAALLAAGYTEE